MICDLIYISAIFNEVEYLFRWLRGICIYSSMEYMYFVLLDFFFYLFV